MVQYKRAHLILTECGLFEETIADLGLKKEHGESYSMGALTKKSPNNKMRITFC